MQHEVKISATKKTNKPNPTTIDLVVFDTINLLRENFGKNKN